MAFVWSYLNVCTNGLKMRPNTFICWEWACMLKYLNSADTEATKKNFIMPPIHSGYYIYSISSSSIIWLDLNACFMTTFAVIVVNLPVSFLHVSSSFSHNSRTTSNIHWRDKFHDVCISDIVLLISLFYCVLNVHLYTCFFCLDVSPTNKIYVHILKYKFLIYQFFQKYLYHRITFFYQWTRTLNRYHFIY